MSETAAVSTPNGANAAEPDALPASAASPTPDASPDAVANAFENLLRELRFAGMSAGADFIRAAAFVHKVDDLKQRWEAGKSARKTRTSKAEG